MGPVGVRWRAGSSSVCKVGWKRLFLTGCKGLTSRALAVRVEKG